MSEGPKLLDRLRRLLGLGGNGRSAPEPPRPPHADELPPGCEDVDEVSCQEAAKRVYEFLDGELDEEQAAAVRCHVEQCRRCYPMFNWEQLFLEALGEKGRRPEPNEELRRRVADLLDSEAG